MIGNAVTRWVARKIEDRVRRVMDARPPDFVIGPTDAPYLRRWWIIPRNAIFNVYLHEFLRDDEDRALHDHPFASISLALSDHAMVEVYARRVRDPDYDIVLFRSYRWVEDRRAIRQGDLVYRQAKFAHRMIVPKPGTLTLFVTGPRIREWGFHCARGWVPWREFVDTRDNGQIGRGCGE